MRFVCPFCGKVYRGASGILVHIRREHLNSSRCPGCGRGFIGYRSLVSHLKNHRDDPIHAVLLYAATGNFYMKKRLRAKVLPVISRV